MEYATAALGNFAAGSQVVKNILREFGVVPALVKLIEHRPDEASAELAVIALKNMSSKNSVNRREIQVWLHINPHGCLKQEPLA